MLKITSNSDKFVIFKHASKWLLFLDWWITNKYENLSNWGSAPGKQNLRVACPKDKLEFKYFSNPGHSDNCFHHRKVHILFSLTAAPGKDQEEQEHLIWNLNNTISISMKFCIVLWCHWYRTLSLANHRTGKVKHFQKDFPWSECKNAHSLLGC